MIVTDVHSLQNQTRFYISFPTTKATDGLQSFNRRFDTFNSIKYVINRKEKTPAVLTSPLCKILALKTMKISNIQRPFLQKWGRGIEGNKETKWSKNIYIYK